MMQRFDVFRKQSKRLIQWLGTVESCEEAVALIRADSIPANRSEDDYLVVQTGVSENFTDPPQKLNVIGL